MHNCNAGKGKKSFLVSLILLIFIFGIIGISLAGESTDDAIVESIQYRIQGYMFQRQGDFDKAVENYKKSIERNPFYACAHNDLGVLYEQIGKPEKAEEEYLLAIKVDPAYANVYSNLALLYERLGKIDKACYCWQMRASMGDPNDKWTKYAKDKYKRLSAMLAEEEKERQERQARLAEKQKARQAKTAAVTAKPGEKAMPGQEIAPSQPLKSVGPSVSPDLAKQIASQEVTERRTQVENTKKMQAYGKTCQQYLDKADRYLRVGEYDSAIRQYNKVQALVPNYPNIEKLINEAENLKIEKERQRKQKADYQRQAEEESKAAKKETRQYKKSVKKHEESAVERAPQKKELQKTEISPKIKRLLDKAEDYSANRQYDLAIKQYNKIAQIDPDFPDLKELIKQVEDEKFKYETDKQNEEQQKKLSKEQENKKEKEIKLSRKINALIAKGEEYVSRGNYDAAIAQYKKAAELDSNYPGLQDLISNAEKMQLDEEQDKSNTALKKEREKKIKLEKTRLSDREQEQEEFGKPEKPRYRGISQENEDERIAKEIEGRLKKAEKYLNNARYSLARAEYEKIKKLDPEQQIDIDSIIEQAKEENKYKKVQKSSVVEKVKEVEKMDQEEARRKSIQDRVERCRQYLVKKEYGLAVTEYILLKDAYPADVQNIDDFIDSVNIAKDQKKAAKHFVTGKRFYDDGKYKEAEKELQLVLDINPNDGEAYRLLKYCQRRTQRSYYGPAENIGSMAAQSPAVVEEQQVQPIRQYQQQTQTMTSAAPSAAVQVQEAPSDIEKRISQEVQKEDKSSPELTTADIEKKYQIIGVVAYRSQTKDMAALNEELLKKAKALGADEVIQVRYFQHVDSVYGYGTAVKKKK